MPAPSSTARRELLWSLLGDLPDTSRPVTFEKVAVQETPTYILEKLVLDLNGLEPVPAFFTRPLNGTRPAPVVLYSHAHFGSYDMGKKEFIQGRSAFQDPPYAEALARAGYAGLCIDSWAFGERRGRTESTIFKHMLWHGQVMWGMMVFDSIRALDYLVSRPDVDGSRIGAMGLSMGSTMSWWVAALDERVKVCVDLCCLTDFEELIAINGLDSHGVYYYVPSLLKHFSTASINSLIAPRPHLAVAGIYDGLTPPRGLDRVDEALKKTYAEAGAPEAWKLSKYDIGHFETAAMRAEIMKWLAKWL